MGVGLMLLVTAAAIAAAEPVQKQERIEMQADDPIPIVNYVMASPRAFLMGAPMEGTDELVVTGAAENFPRADGTLEIPVGTRVIFSLSRETEGVWHEGTYGTIETALTVQWFEAVTATDCEQCALDGLRDEPVVPGEVGKKTEAGGSVEVAPCPWITIATDGAHDTRNGPSLGYTKVGVPIEFTLPGTYCVRGIVSTSVRSSSLRPPEPSQPPATKQEAAAEPSPTLLALDTDVVHVKVQVVDRMVPGTKPQGPTTDDPDVIFNRPMPNSADTKAPQPDENDPKDPGAIKLLSPGTSVSPRDYDLRIPF